jgi:heat shock protein HslJ
MDLVKKTKNRSHLPVLAGLLMIIPILLAAGCTGNVPEPAGPVLDGTRWILTDYVIEGVSWPALGTTTVTLEFPDDKRITGSAGCNHYFSDYRMKGTTIAIGPAGRTEMYFTGPGVMEQESAYLALLNTAATATTGNDRLTLADAKGRTILIFTRQVPPAPEPLTGTNWTLDSLYSGDAVSSVLSGTMITAVFDREGRVSGSTGCNHYSGSYTVTENSLAISSLGSTKMACQGEDIMQQESTYLASLNSAAGFTISGNRLKLADERGTTLLSFTGEP